MKYGWVLMAAVLVAINMGASRYHYRADLTEEKRYTLSAPTKQILRRLNERITITVLLEGEMPASFKKLSNSCKDLLQEFKDIGGGHIQFSFKKPAEGLDDSTKQYFYDSLASLGIRPYNIKAQVKAGEGQEERFVFPGAVVSAGDRVLGIDMLAGQSSVLDQSSINRSEATLEYKFINAIHKLTMDSVANVAYLLGNGETFTYNVYDLVENNLKKNYGFAFLPIDSVRSIPPVFSTLIIAKPTIRFTDQQKLKIDQFVMHGGKVLWMIDQLYAEIDSLQRSNSSFIAFDRGLNLEDLLFKYGVRINGDLVQDLTCDKLPSKVGDAGGKPQFELLPWPYFPLLSNYTNHPIAKNLDYVLAQFPNSIDTVKAPGIKKTILLATSDASRILGTPARVEWNTIQTEDDIRRFTGSNVPVAVLLEGKFNSLYSNRLSYDVLDSLNSIGRPYIPKADKEGKMIVIADGDLALNFVKQSEGPLQMGMNPYTQHKYANTEFVMNCLEYLTDNSGILETRAKDFTLRLLDKKKVDADKSTWVFLNLAVPVLLILLFGGIFNFMRKKKFSGKI